MKEKGFTLVELLIVIAIMLSLLTISVVSFIEVSNNKKEKTWENVKEEMVLAGEQFFNNKKYYLEGLSDNNSYARVSIGSLVEEDYLNVVTNPKTNKLISSCDYIEVKLNTNKYTYNYVKNTSNNECDVKNYVIVSELGAPSINITMDKATGNDNWYIKDTKIKATIKTNSNGAIKEVKYCENKDKCDILTLNASNIYEKDAIDGKEVTAIFTATNVFGKSSSASVIYKKDTEKPVINSFNVISKEEGYNSNKVKLSWNIKDDISGIGKVETNIKNNLSQDNWDYNGKAQWQFNKDNNSKIYFSVSNSLDGKRYTPKLTVTDIAGNVSSKKANEYEVYTECSEKEETGKEETTGECSETCGNGTKIKTITTNYIDKYTKKSCTPKKQTSKLSCSDKSGCIPTITNVSFRINKEKCPNGWVEMKYKDINIDEYTAEITYSHSVQNTKNTVSTDKSKTSGETFCRGYGSSQNNIMSFKVTITNSLNESKKATFEGKCYWNNMYDKNNNLIEDKKWHDCTLLK